MSRPGWFRSTAVQGERVGDAAGEVVNEDAAFGIGHIDHCKALAIGRLCGVMYPAGVLSSGSCFPEASQRTMTLPASRPRRYTRVPLAETSYCAQPSGLATLSIIGMGSPASRRLSRSHRTAKSFPWRWNTR